MLTSSARRSLLKSPESELRHRVGFQIAVQWCRVFVAPGGPVGESGCAALGRGLSLTCDLGTDTAIRTAVTECSGSAYSNRRPGIGDFDLRLEARFRSKHAFAVSRAAAFTVVAVPLFPSWPLVPSNSTVARMGSSAEAFTTLSNNSVPSSIAVPGTSSAGTAVPDEGSRDRIRLRIRHQTSGANRRAGSAFDTPCSRWCFGNIFVSMSYISPPPMRPRPHGGAAVYPPAKSVQFWIAEYAILHCRQHHLRGSGSLIRSRYPATIACICLKLISIGRRGLTFIRVQHLLTTGRTN